MMKLIDRTFTRLVIPAAISTAATLMLSGCNGGTPVEPEDAKQAVVDIVGVSAETLGGEWQVYSGPAVRGCTKGSGGDGAAYAYTLMRGPTTVDPEADVTALEELWTDRGIATERYQSGSAAPTLGIRGAGGPTTSIDLLADARGYSISAVSECADGNASEMQGNGE